MGPYEKEKQTVLSAVRWLSANGYLGKKSSGGNVSVKVCGKDAVAITPSGKSYLQLAVGDVCVVDFDLQPLDSLFAPSIETAMHIGIYRRRSDVQAVVHTHQTYAALLAVLNRSIPALFDEIVYEIGPQVEIIAYAISGSRQLVENVAVKLDNDCLCYLIQNHGALCLGATMDDALKNAELLEKEARVYYYALASGREITTLPPASVDHFIALRKSK